MMVPRLIWVLIILGIGFRCVLGMTVSERNITEKHIWQLEEAYWQYWVDGDIESYMALPTGSYTPG